MLSPNEYCALVEQAPILIWRANTTAACDYFNDRWLQFRGRTLEQEQGNGWAEGVHPDDFDRCLKIYLDSFHARRIFEMEYRLMRGDGIYRWIFDRGVPFYGADGAFAGYIGSCIDVTERVEAEAAARQAHELAVQKAAAEESSRQKSAFIANMSHEIRTPMTGVLGMVDLLAETSLTPEQLDYTETIRYSAGALLRIVNDILDFSKIDAGKLELISMDFDVRGEIRRVRDLVGVLASEKRIHLEVSAAPEVPEIIHGDPGRLRQILLNLAGNAVKFTPEGGVVRIAASVDGGNRLRFDVVDTGIGIAPDVLPRLFSPYSQAEPVTGRLNGGTGLGLSITKLLTELMGGEIGVTSDSGSGSTFWFRVPLCAASAPASGGTSAPREALTAAPRRPGWIRVLVAEDNPVNQRVIARMLAHLGYTCSVAGTGRQAVDAYIHGSHDAVLMDCYMPDLDGFEATARIRAWEQPRGRHTPIIALTASALNSDREKCLAAGMDDFLSKPLDLQLLTIALERWIRAEPSKTGSAAPSAEFAAIAPIESGRRMGSMCPSAADRIAPG